MAREDLQRIPPADARGESAVEEATAATAGCSVHPVQVGGGRVATSAPAIADDISGEGLAYLLERAWEGTGETKTQFFAALSNHPTQFLTTLRRTDRPKPVTLDRCRRFLRGEAVSVPPLKVQKRHVQSMRGTNQTDDGPVERAERLALSHRAADERRGGETMADAVRRCGRELDAEEAVETVATALPARRAFQPVAPERWGQLAALAARMGVSQSAALDLALGVGIAGLNEDLDEEEAK